MASSHAHLQEVNQLEAASSPGGRSPAVCCTTGPTTFSSHLPDCATAAELQVPHWPCLHLRSNSKLTSAPNSPSNQIPCKALGVESWPGLPTRGPGSFPLLLSLFASTMAVLALASQSTFGLCWPCPMKKDHAQRRGVTDTTPSPGACCQRCCRTAACGP